MAKQELLATCRLELSWLMTGWSGNEQYLKEAVKRMLAGRPWSPAEMAQVASQYGFEPEAEG